MTKAMILTCGVVLCIMGLTLHFTAESLGGMQDHFIGGQIQDTFDSHEEDQFVLNETEGGNTTQRWISLPFVHPLKAISRPLPPPLQPPKPI